MRLATCHYRQAQWLALLTGEHAIIPALVQRWPRTMLELIDAGPDSWARFAEEATALGDAAQVPASGLGLAAPIPRPRKNVFCLGLNYADHAEESYRARGRTPDYPQHPVVFSKAPTAVAGPHAPVPYEPDVSSEIDFEGELAVVIGTGGRHIAEQNALEHVFGYTILNDLTARDLQRRHKQFLIGKSLDGHGPMGPVIVTADEIPDPHALRLRTWVNGTLRQDASTGDQLFSVARVIAELSRALTLEPGDIIATGTPSGVGFARQPPEFLRPGDEVTVGIEPIGTIRNRIQLTRGDG